MSFVAPLFLFGLLSLLAPWLLHRLNERDAPVKDFPSDRFLEATTSVSARHKRLRYWFLLLLRLLALAILCLLFAQPLLKRFGFLSSEPETLHLLVMDQSFSMREGERWARAQDKLSEVVAEIPAHMPIQLMGVEAQASRVVEQTLDRDALLDAVTAMRPGFASFDYAALMRQLDNVAERQNLPVVVHLFTDAQASAMPARLNDLVTRGIEEVKLWHVAEEPVPNLGITAAVVPANENQFSLEVTVRHYGDTDSLPAQKIVLQIPGEDALERDLSPRAAADFAPSDKEFAGFRESQLVFEGLSWPAGDRLETYALSVTPGDSLTEDDRLELPVRMTVPTRIQIVEFNSGGRSISNNDPWLFLSTAYRLDHTNQVTRLRSDSSEALQGSDMVVVIDETPLVEGALPILSDRIQRYLDGGGTMLYVLNDIPESNESSSSDGIVRVDQVDQTHPLALDGDGWRDVAFYALQNVDSRETDVLIQSTNGRPILMETSLEQGKLMWLNAPLTGSDNDLPISPVFVPFLRSLADYYLHYDRYPVSLAVGETVKLGQSVQLLDPDGESLLSLSQSLGGSVHSMARPGIYTILDQQGEHPMVVSVPDRESDTRSAPAETLSAWTSSTAADGQLSSVVNTDSDSNVAETSSTLSDTPQAPLLSLAKWLLPLCALLFFLEALVANHHVRVRRA